jgi:hypothetical protein
MLKTFYVLTVITDAISFQNMAGAITMHVPADIATARDAI